MKKILMICFVAVLSSCTKDFLDRSPLDAIGTANFWKNSQDAYLGLNGVYDVLQDPAVYGGSLNNGAAGLPMYDCFGDNLYNNYKFEGPGLFMEGTIDPSHYFFSGLWNSCYKGIFRANSVLENIPNIPAGNISDAERAQLSAQALFLRALFYMNLAVYYQDAPLILKTQAVSEGYVAKNTYQEISDQVIKDLTTAANALPMSYPSSQYGYATKGAALGILARFQLYNKNYQAVLDATNALMSLGYGLNPSYSQLFTEQGENSNEIIFSVRFNEDVSKNRENFSSTYAGIPRVDEQPMPNMVKDYYCTDGKPITTSPLYNPGTPTNNTPQKNNRDPRLLASVYFKGDIFITDINKAFSGNTATTYGLKKYIRNKNYPDGTGVFAGGGQDFIVIRYADVLLMRAEALLGSGTTAGVSALVNQVRARVNMPSVESVEGSNLSLGTLQAIVRHERRVELAFEGLRYFDLKRWGTVQSAAQTAAADNVTGYSPTYRAGGKSEIFAIPLKELDANENLKQNPVWQ
ncbi:RagB/SusD family nutrient uptake outer membrane protein [Pedobacter sp. SD-b]|uniref:RagB/SusD family nutrient uptake outer membrane protein n=1 Tax=Pedobacter segetis TaxID=2793069 RepID=A0ABS1BLX5_9SPHI|nr:RagB/SusD family nutrient uptake outer membrane protein [Pedobacter segetis]MBK0383898.1 RagB/SusD family nutrient uptake outer membrane protein [Pedobacter segetis]